MKRNKKTRFAAILFTLSLVTTSIVGGTFAKYTTTGQASDTAVVAKWGVVINTSGSLFSNAYVETSNDKPVVWNSDFKNSDNSFTVATSTSTEGNIVAPGTQSDSGLTFGITGKPEVSTQISATIKARDIYLAKGYTYAVMTKITTVTAENYTKLVTEYNAEDSTNKLYEKTTDGYVLQKIAETDGTNFNANGEYYVLSNEISIEGQNDTNYYPVVYSLAGKANTSDTGIAASSTKAVADALTKMLVISDAQAVEGEAGTDKNLGLTVYTVDASSTQTVSDKANTKVINTFAPNTDIGDKLSGEQLTWKWDYEGKDSEDTILGDMITASKDASNTNYYVVAKKSTNNYKDVSYTKDTDTTVGKSYVYLGEESTDNIVASLETSFDISLTVTQVD